MSLALSGVRPWGMLRVVTSENTPLKMADATLGARTRTHTE